MEDDARQCLGDLLLVAPAFGEREVKKCLAAGSFGNEGVAPEQQHEHAQPMLGVGSIRCPWREVADKRRQIDFDKSFRPSAGLCPIKPPELPVGQKAPAHGSVRLRFGAAEIAQDLRRRGFVIAGCPIEPRVARLVLDDNGPEPEAIDRRQWPGARLSFGVDK